MGILDNLDDLNSLRNLMIMPTSLKIVPSYIFDKFKRKNEPCIFYDVNLIEFIHFYPGDDKDKDFIKENVENNLWIPCDLIMASQPDTYYPGNFVVTPRGPIDVLDETTSTYYNTIWNIFKTRLNTDFAIPTIVASTFEGLHGSVVTVKDIDIPIIDNKDVKILLEQTNIEYFHLILKQGKEFSIKVNEKDFDEELKKNSFFLPRGFVTIVLLEASSVLIKSTKYDKIEFSNRFYDFVFSRF